MENPVFTWNDFKKSVDEKLAAAGESGDSTINYIDVSWDSLETGIDVIVTPGGGSFSVSA